MRGFSGVVSGISSIRVCDEFCFCVCFDVLVSAISLAILEKNTDNTDRQRIAQPEQVCAPDSSLSVWSVFFF